MLFEPKGRMRKSLIPLLLLSACNNDPEPVSGSGNAAADLDVLPPAPSAAEPEQKARAAVGTIIQDPASASYANIRAGSAGSICGSVNPKGKDGRLQGFRPFVVSPEGVALVSATPQVMFTDPADMFPDFHIRYCAAPEELPALERQMSEQRAQADGNDVNLFDLPAPAPAIPELPPPPPAAAAPAEPPPPPRPRPGPPPPPGSEDSFFNSVMRPADDPKPK